MRIARTALLEQARFHRTQAKRARRLTRFINHPQALDVLTKLADEMERLASRLAREATKAISPRGRTRRYRSHGGRRSRRPFR
jgi:hypothetical protein